MLTIDLYNLDMNVFKKDYSTDDKMSYKLYTAEVWAVALNVMSV